MQHRLPALAVLLNALVWGLTWWPFRQLAALGLHPLWTTVLVYGVALLGLLLWSPGAWRTVVAQPGLWALMLASGLTNVGFNWAVTVGDVVRVVLLFYLMPAWSVLLAWCLLDEKPTGASLARLALALTGVLLVLQRPGSSWPVPESLADGLALMAGFCFALTSTLLRKLHHARGDARAVAMFAGGVITAGAVALAGWASQAIAVPTGLSWAALAVALPLAGAILAGNLTLQYGAARLAAHQTALIMLSEIVFAGVSAIAAGAADLNARTVAGASLIGLAAILATRRSGPRRGA